MSENDVKANVGGQFPPFVGGTGGNFKVLDSGERQQFASGAHRDIQQGKGRFDLIPTLPIRRLARVYEEGAKKYGDHNYQKGIPLSRYLDSCERHLNNLKAGEPTEDHALQAVWNLFSYVWTLAEIEGGRLPKSLDDRPKPEPQYAPKHEAAFCPRHGREGREPPSPELPGLACSCGGVK